MVPLLAKNAVQIKCKFSSAVMTGNYECAYALGILTAAAGLPEITAYESIAQLKEQVMSAVETFQPDEEALQRLIEMLKEYEPSDSLDEQMRELYIVGFADKKL